MDHNPPPWWAWAAGGAAILWLVGRLKEAVVYTFSSQKKEQYELLKSIQADVKDLTLRVGHLETDLAVAKAVTTR